MSVKHIGGATILTGEAIPAFRKLALRQGLRLEIAGLRKHGKSCYQIIRNEFGLRGSKKTVFNKFIELLRQEGVLR